MARPKYLIDTNVAIEYIGETLPEKVLARLDDIFDDEFFISVINQIELLGFTNISVHEESKFNELIYASNILGLTNLVVNSTIEIRKKFRMKLPDAIIAATALSNQLILVSRNIKDFDKIEGLNIISPLKLANL